MQQLVDMLLVADQDGKLAITEVCVFDLDDVSSGREPVAVVRERVDAQRDPAPQRELVIVPDLKGLDAVEVVVVVPVPVQDDIVSTVLKKQ